MESLDDLERFYGLMDRLEENTGERRRLSDCDPATDPELGVVYFFFENGERRSGSGKGDRVVRVGKCKKFRRRISTQHKGPADEMVRGSVFRKWVHNALFLKFRETEFADWPDITEENIAGMLEALNPDRQQRLARATSKHMWPMELLFVPIGRESSRQYIERNAIALLSEYGVDDPIDPPSRRWLGRHSRSDRIRSSGLWNSTHVANGYEPAFLDRLERYVNRARG